MNLPEPPSRLAQTILDRVLLPALSRGERKLPATGHEHRMEPLAWTSRRHAGEEEGGYPPRVLFSCTHGVCSRTEVVAPTKHSRKAPAFMAEEQFQQMRAGQYWDEIVGG